MPKKTKTSPIQPDPDLEDSAQPDADLPEPKVPAMVNDAPGPRPKATVVKSSVPLNPKPSSKKKMWIWIAVIFVVVAGATAASFYVFFPSKTTLTVSTNTNSNANATALQPRALDGVPVPPDQVNPQIIAVMIENSWESRPASGINQASVVYEALAEGGITRFMALFPSTATATEIGPVRSARQYYIDEAEEYHPLYTHVGGSPQALAYLKTGKANVVDFNQFYNAPMFWRDRTRPAPHNLYSKMVFLNLGVKKFTMTNAPTYTPWSFKDETPIDSRGNQSNDIVINFSSFNYKVTYKYDRGLNQYQRYQADQPMVMRDGSPIEAKNVVVEYLQTGLLAGDKERLSMQTTGTGQMLMFRDGQVIQGSWKKDTVTSRTQFLDAQGNTVALDPGQTWIELVPSDRKITY